MTIELSTLGAPIKTAYESQPDTNAFTDAEKTKLANLAAVASTGNFSDLVGTPTFIEESRIGQNNGIAPLDSSGLVPVKHLNVSGLEFKGGWNPLTNDRGLIDGVGSVGDFYKATHSGTYNTGNADYTYNVGDWIIYAAGVWQRIGSNESVVSVNGQNAEVVLDAAAVGARPDTWTPTWTDIRDKPDLDGLYQQKNPGNISPAIPAALLRRSTAISYASGRRVIVWNETVYDNFGGVHNGTYVVPEWAKYARVTVYVRLTNASDGQYLYAYAVKNGEDIAMVGHPVAGNTSQTAVVISPIVPVVTGDILTGALYHNSSGNRTLVHGESGVYMQIELFQSV